MKMRTKLMMMTAALALTGSMALALTADELVSQFQAEGYSWIEVKSGPGQIKVEAIKGTEKVEIVYDSATGAVLKREVEAASIEDQARTGVETVTVGQNFEDGDDNDDDSGDDSADDDSDDDSGDDDSDDSSDDDSDDDSSDDSDDDSDGGNSGSGGGDDDGGDDD